MSEIMIHTEHLTKQYGKLKAVNDVSIDIYKGSIVGLVGKNGAGKTTLIRLITGLTLPTSGTFAVLPGKERKDTSVAAIVERPSIYTGMTGMDNLRVQCKLLGIACDDDYLQKTLQLVKLNPQNTQIVKNYSLGMKQRLAIAMTLVGKPELLILDEPTNGLDPEGIHDMRQVFVEITKTLGATIIVSSHLLSELSKFATEYYFMDKGKIIKHCSAEELEHLGAKRLRLTVKDVQQAQTILSKLGRVDIVAENTVELYGDNQPTQVLLELSKENVQVTNIINIGDNLEDYFISLIGGAQ